MTATAMSRRGVSICRGCASERLASVLDLGEQPLANELHSNVDSQEECFPLHLRICKSCGLGQVGEYVPPERIFSDYPYLSSVSQSWVDHSRAYAVAMRDDLCLGSEDLVIEVASNDGYLLREFAKLGIRVLGIEPAANVAEIARRSGIPTEGTFFGRSVAERIVASHGHPRLVIANNVMAHVPDLEDFVTGIAALCDDETIVTVENPAFTILLRETQFDTIYHEHFSYLSAHAVDCVSARHGLQLIRVDRLSTHGGSHRYWMAKQGTAVPESSVAEVIESELFNGLLDPAAWASFAVRSHAVVTRLRAWLAERTSVGSRVVAYGAAAKGNTMLNAAQVTREQILAVADGSSEKQGKFLPGSRIPIVAPDSLGNYEPNDVLILPWNLAAELRSAVSQLCPQAASWIAVPTVRRLAP